MHLLTLCPSLLSPFDEVHDSSARVAGSPRGTRGICDMIISTNPSLVRGRSLTAVCVWVLLPQFPRPELETTIHEIVKEAPRLLQALVSTLGWSWMRAGDCPTHD